ncbi:MAG: AraC family transcriptional regulator [Bdellovibrionales bacterium]|nr:AraC family transcriptional regulator [Bdellovibrionales bacterium]NQZ18242.1 AraC family transcriptional regulator [Bdellovibrionales bacterium]
MSTNKNPLNRYGDVLHYLKLDSIYYSRSTLGGQDWGVELPPFENTSMFHIVTSGSCLVEVKGETIHLQSGDLVFISRTCGHKVIGANNKKAINLFDLPINQISETYETLEIDTNKEGLTTLLCGVVRISHPAGEMLINEMPDLIHIKRDHHMFGDMMGEIVRLVFREASGNFIGGETVITRLADVLLIQAIRSWVMNSNELHSKWIKALADEKIGKALSCIHQHPERNWTIENLGFEVGLSRTAFANRFKEIVGDSVLNYITKWRMNLAVMKIKEGKKVDIDFVESLGYKSESAFRRTFKRAMGINLSEVGNAS